MFVFDPSHPRIKRGKSHLIVHGFAKVTVTLTNDVQSPTQTVSNPGKKVKETI